MERWSLSGETASIIMSSRKGFLDIFDFYANSPALVRDKSVFLCRCKFERHGYCALSTKMIGQKVERIKNMLT